MRSSGNQFFLQTNDGMPDRYAINMLWLNQTLDPLQRYVCPAASEEELIDKLVGRAAKWQAANPEADVSIWYDSRFASNDAVLATQQVMEKFPRIKLRDIREIATVQNNPDAFSDMVPIYAKVDLIKLILCVHSIEQEKNDAAIFADVDIGEYHPGQNRLCKKELFNPQTMKKLNAIGIELGRDDNGKLENQFIQVMRKAETLRALQLLIDATLLRIITTLNTVATKGIIMLGHLNSGLVTTTLTKEITKLIEGLRDGSIKINLQTFDWNREPEWIPYEPEKHGVLPLGNFYFAHSSTYMVYLLEKDNSICKDTYETIRLPERNGNIELGRYDLNTKPGHAHRVEQKSLIQREPENGQEYRCNLVFPTIQPDHMESVKFNRRIDK